jgi:PAS domain S-box-containing protein
LSLSAVEPFLPGQIADALPALIAYVDADERYRFVNAAYSTWFGVTKEQLQGLTVEDLLGPDLATAVRPHRQAALSGESVFFETFVAHTDGSRRFVEARYVPDIDDAGRPRGYYVLIVDRSDSHRREAAEASERRHEEQLKLALEASGLGDWTWEASTDLLTLSPRAAEIYGVPAEPMTWAELRRIIHPEDAERATVAASRAIREHTPHQIEYRVRRPGDGAEVWLQVRGHAVYDAAGEPLSMRGVVSDISPAKRAEIALLESEARLRETEERFRLAAEDAPVMLWVADEVGRTVYLNRAMREFWGVEGDPALFSWSVDLVEEDRPRLQALLTDAMVRQAPFDCEARYRPFGGEERLVSCHGEPRRDADGRFAGMIGVIVDITAARKAETHQRLLINELNHRVKNTLATVQSIAYQTLREGMVSKDARDLLTSRLLALSAAHNVLTRENWEAAEIAEITAEAIRPYIDDESRRISLEGPPARVGPTVALAISMALHELATNAAKYGALSGAAGRVTIIWRAAEDGRIELSWRESGGPPVTQPSSRGFGSRLLTQGLAAELGFGARLEFAPTGVTCRISAPVLNQVLED